MWLTIYWSKILKIVISPWRWKRAHMYRESEMISHIIELEGTKDYVFSSVSGRLFPLIPFMIPFLPFFSLVPLNEYNWSLLWWIIPFFPFSLFIMFPLRMLSGEVFQLVRWFITKSGLISNKWSHARGLEVEKLFFIFLKTFFYFEFCFRFAACYGATTTCWMLLGGIPWDITEELLF